MQPLKDFSEFGFIAKMADNKLYWFLPFLGGVLSDNQEQDQQCAVRQGAQSARPSRSTLVPKKYIIVGRSGEEHYGSCIGRVVLFRDQNRNP